jgi:hypothetical protein
VAAWGARAFVTVPFFMDILAGVTLVGLNRLVFGLLPATFLDGHAIASYSRALWTAVFGPTLAVFLLGVTQGHADKPVTWTSLHAIARDTAAGFSPQLECNQI